MLQKIPPVNSFTGLKQKFINGKLKEKTLTLIPFQLVLVSFDLVKLLKATAETTYHAKSKETK
jgi:hypothetical protein